MHVTALPGQITDADLEAWLAHQVEMPCEFAHAWQVGGPWEVCDQQATACIVTRPMVAGCADPHGPAYVCSLGLASVQVWGVANSVYCEDGHPLRVTWIERVR